MIRNAPLVNLVKDELDVTLIHAETQVMAFSEGRDGVGLDECAEAFKQIAGICKMTGLDGADLLSKELFILTRNLMTDSDDEALKDGINGLTMGITMLVRYFDYVKCVRYTFPELMLPAINELKLLQNKPVLPDSFFFLISNKTYDLAIKALMPSSAAMVPQSSDLRRLRHMYQVGLLEILQDTPSGFRLMKRALERVGKLCGPSSVGETWALAQLAANAMLNGSVSLTRSRKLLFTGLDRELKLLALNSDKYLASVSSPELIKELCYLIALNNTSSGALNTFKKSLMLADSFHSDESMRLEQKYISGPDGSVVHAVAVAVGDELIKLKEVIAEYCRDLNAEKKETLVALLLDISKTLEMLEVCSLADAMKDQAEYIKNDFSSASQDRESKLQGLIELVLRSESAMSGLMQGHRLTEALINNGDKENDVSLSILEQASVLIVEESCSALVLSKSALTSFLDSKYDPLHLGNVPASLHTVWGGLLFLNLERAAGILFNATKYIEDKLLGGNSVAANDNDLDTLADAITSVDYYLESMVQDKPMGEGILEVAEESMEALGYPA